MAAFLIFKLKHVTYLYVWDPSKADPFTIAAGVPDDYTISKKIVKDK